MSDTGLIVLAFLGGNLTGVSGSWLWFTAQARELHVALREARGVMRATVDRRRVQP